MWVGHGRRAGTKSLPRREKPTQTFLFLAGTIWSPSSRDSICWWSACRVEAQAFREGGQTAVMFTCTRGRARLLGQVIHLWHCSRPNLPLSILGGGANTCKHRGSYVDESVSKQCHETSSLFLKHIHTTLKRKLYGILILTQYANKAMDVHQTILQQLL